MPTHGRRMQPVCGSRPVEATALGNLLVQAVALGPLPKIAAGRAAMAMSYEQTTYEPRPLGDWDAAIIRVDALVGAATAS